MPCESYGTNFRKCIGQTSPESSTGHNLSGRTWSDKSQNANAHIPQLVKEADCLNGLAQSHLVCKDGRSMIPPVPQQPVHTLTITKVQTNGTEILAILFVFGYRGHFDVLFQFDKTQENKTPQNNLQDVHRLHDISSP